MKVENKQQEEKNQKIELNDDFDFFDTPSENPSEEEEFVKVKTTKDGEKTKLIEDEIENSEEDQIEFFSEKEKESEEKEENENEDSSDTFKAVKILFDKGIFTKEDEEELTEENSEELLKKTFKKSVDTELKDILDALPKKSKGLITHVLNGGSEEEYFKGITQAPITEDMNLEEEDAQESMVSYKLKNEGFDDEYIKDEIADLKEKGRLEKAARTFHTSWKKSKKEIEQKEQDKIKKEKELQEKELKDTKEYYKNKLKEKDSFEGFKITKEDRESLPDYLVEKKYRLQNGVEITEHQKDVFEIMKNKDKALLHAKILRTGLDLKKIKALVTTEITKEFEDNIRRSRDFNSKQINKKSGTYNPLDYF